MFLYCWIGMHIGCVCPVCLFWGPRDICQFIHSYVGIARHIFSLFWFNRILVRIVSWDFGPLNLTGQMQISVFLDRIGFWEPGLNLKTLLLSWAIIVAHSGWNQWFASTICIEIWCPADWIIHRDIILRMRCVHSPLGYKQLWQILKIQWYIKRFACERSQD